MKLFTPLLAALALTAHFALAASVVVDNFSDQDGTNNLGLRRSGKQYDLRKGSVFIKNRGEFTEEIAGKKQCFDLRRKRLRFCYDAERNMEVKVRFAFHKKGCKEDGKLDNSEVTLKLTKGSGELFVDADDFDGAKLRNGEAFTWDPSHEFNLRDITIEDGGRDPRPEPTVR